MKIADLPPCWKKVGREFRKPLKNHGYLVVFRRPDRSGWALCEFRNDGTGLWPFTDYNTAADAIGFVERSWR